MIYILIDIVGGVDGIIVNGVKSEIFFYSVFKWGDIVG